MQARPVQKRAAPQAQLANVHTQNTLDNYYNKVSRPLGITLGYTVNYGTNPPACNAGGGPSSNGANLVAAANIKKSFGIKYWEIGNELFGGGTFETDFHPSPGIGCELRVLRGPLL